MIPALVLAVLVGEFAALVVIGAHTSVPGHPPLWALDLQAVVALCAGLLTIHVVFVRRDPRVPVASEPKPAEPEAWICSHCLRPYVPGAHFCPHCACPLTFFANTGGYEYVHARAWGLGKALHHPSRWTHHAVVLLWGYVGVPLALWVLFQMPFEVKEPLAWFGHALALLVYAANIWIVGAFAWYGSRALGRRLRREPPPTPEIEYGVPPWWTYDTEWALPEVIDEGE